VDVVSRKCISFPDAAAVVFALDRQKFTLRATGLHLSPAGLGMLCSYPWMGTFGFRCVSASGPFLALLGTLPFALLRFSNLAEWAISIPPIAAANSSVPKETIPVATTAVNIVQWLGGPVAKMALATFLHERTL
jgi:hypothetical protein